MQSEQKYLFSQCHQSNIGYFTHQLHLPELTTHINQNWGYKSQKSPITIDSYILTQSLHQNSHLNELVQKKIGLVAAYIIYQNKKQFIAISHGTLIGPNIILTEALPFIRNIDKQTLIFKFYIDFHEGKCKQYDVKEFHWSKLIYTQLGQIDHNFAIIVTEQKVGNIYGYWGVYFDEESLFPKNNKLVSIIKKKSQKSSQLTKIDIDECRIDRECIKLSQQDCLCVIGGEPVIDESEQTLIGLYIGNNVILRMQQRIRIQLNKWIKKQVMKIKKIRQYIRKQDIQDFANKYGKKVEYLNLSHNQLTCNQIKAVRQGPWKLLTTLNLELCHIGDEGVSQLLKAELYYLQNLQLSQNNLTNTAVKYLSEKPWKNLKIIWLCTNEIDDEAIIYFKSSNWDKMTGFNLGGLNFTQQGLRQLMNIKWANITQMFLVDTKKNIKNTIAKSQIASKQYLNQKGHHIRVNLN